MDRFQNAVHISIDVRIAEAQHAITQLGQSALSRCVTLAVSIEAMLHAIDLDDQTTTTTFEIDNVVRDWDCRRK
jgi:hypothetical protein